MITEIKLIERFFGCYFLEDCKESFSFISDWKKGVK